MPVLWNKWGNESLIETLEKELPQSTFYWLLISIVSAIAWVVFLTYYNSRVLGLILTAILNRFSTIGHIKLGSFSVSVLSGKIMFRDVHIVTEDYSLRIQLGLAIFRWWRPLIPKDLRDDFSHSETRLSVYLDSFELHVYNRSAHFSRLEKLFGLDQLINLGNDDQPPPKKDNKDKWQWRDLIPVIKFEISSGRILFGNYLVPYTLSLNFGDAHMVYTTKPASTPFDQFMHIVKCRADNIRVMLVQSPKFQGIAEMPPRYMGEGFVLMQSNDVDLYYYHDLPGVVPYEPELVQLANGDVIARRTWPCWGMDIKCGKGTDISYGPWADRQREYIWKFFYPPDFQPMEQTKLPEPGQPRMWKSFDFKMSMQADTTIDILFSKTKETQAVHMNCQAGTYLEFSIPWVTEETGYVSKINGQLMHLDATTSLPFRSLLECETFEFTVEINYPRNWNDHQDWKVDLTACKASGDFIFHHKVFFIDLIDDWSTKVRPDVYHFVPYTWKFNLILKEFELLTVTNEWNWIDCFGQTPENAHIAFCGDTFDLGFSLPFTDYLPATVPLKFFIRGESVDLRLYLPETNTSRHVVQAMSENARIMGRDGNILEMPFQGQGGKKWRRLTPKNMGWIDCACTPIIALSIGYNYHPIPPSGDATQRLHEEPISTPDAEEMLLIPLRLTPIRPLRPKKFMKTTVSAKDFDPTTLDADVISVEIEIGPTILCLYGSLLRHFIHIKEDYFGEDQKFTDFAESFSSADKASAFEHIISSDNHETPFDPRHYRPLAVKVTLTAHDIHAHLMKNCNEGDPPCPSLFLERIGFEMNKQYEATELQVLVSPAVIIAKDAFEQRPDAHGHLKDGHLALSGLQIRGHAMFSHVGLPLDAETLEYSWSLEVMIGDLTGKLSAAQLQQIIEFLQTFVFLVEDSENDLQRSVPYYKCQHMLPQPECRIEPRYSYPCPSAEDIKYRMTRVTLDCVDLYLTEAGTALNVQIYPIRLSTCNLHGTNNKAGITALIPTVNLKQFVLSVPINQQYTVQDCWLEAGGVCLGPINVDAAMALPGPEFHAMQDKFLKMHDEKTRRLWFLWAPDYTKMNPKVVGKCGCIGGCNFFGSNRNGLKFFHPSDNDFIEGVNAAVFHLCKDERDMGYGQSLHDHNQYMFDLHNNVMHATPIKKKNLTRGKAVDMTSPDAVFRDTSRAGRTSGYLSDTQSSVLPDDSRTDTMSSDRTITDSVKNEWATEGTGNFSLTSVEEKEEHESVSKKSSVPSEYLPGSSIPDAYDTDRYVSTPSDAGPFTSGASGAGSVSSLPEMVSRKTNHLGHERKASYDPSRAYQKAATSDVNRQGSVGSVSTRRDSRGSLPSSTHSAISRQSSLTSPVLRRLSSQVSMRDSASSVTGSEQFFSAAEDMGDSLTSLPSSEGRYGMSEGARRNLSRQMSMSSEQTASPSPYYSLSEESWDGLDQSTLQATVIESSQAPDTDTDSESVASFVSAVSSQRTSRPEMRDLGELSDDEITIQSDDSQDGYETEVPASNYIDLHGQMNNMITKSPLLMSCYMNHMTQLRCTHWIGPPPHCVGMTTTEKEAQTPANGGASEKNSVNGNAAPSWIPQFEYINEGFTPRLMTNKRELRSPPSVSSPSSTSEFDKERKFFPSNDDVTGEESATFAFSESGTDSSFTYEDHVSKTTAVVNLKGSIDIMVSPLMLEALQRYMEAVTPLLATLHPSAIVDSLHFQSSSSVKAQNKLKQNQSENESAEKKEKDEACSNKVEGEHTRKTSRLQVMFSLSRINICILQASLVEEMISFAALDKIRELTCVSVLACSVDNISCQLLMNNISQKSLEIGSDASPDSGKQKPIPMPAGPDKLQKQGSVNLDATDGIAEMVERQQEDMVGSLRIARIHFQLRRMKKHSNFADNIFLTAIPEHRSKVLFTFQKQHALLTPPPERDASTHSTPVSRPSSSTARTSTIVEEDSAEDIAGFIMFECGLEDINLKAARRVGYSNKSSQQEEENLQHISRLLQQHHVPTHGETSPPRAPPPAPPPAPSTPPRESRDDGSDSASNHSTDGSASACSADDERSWQSRVSMDSTGSDVGGHATRGESKELEGDASSCSLEFKTVWFNFAAPPPSPKKKKLEFTRLDWNLLSTATPAINAWMNPSHRAIVAAKTLVSKLNERICTVMACIMTEALEEQGIHMPVKSKHDKITSLSKTLQEDPSCQLLTVLRRYIHKVGTKIVEDSVTADTIPQLITIQKGLLALTRQWKNVLYMPILAENNFKSKKKVTPYTVTFAIPQDESIDNFQTAIDDDQSLLDNYEVVDEKTSLLKAEEPSLHSFTAGVQTPSRPTSVVNYPTTGDPAVDGKPISLENIDKKGKSKGLKGLVSIPGISTPFSSVESPGKNAPSQRSQSFGMPPTGGSQPVLQHQSSVPKLRRNESNISFSAGSNNSSSDHLHGASIPGTPMRQSLTKHLSELEKREDEDLYRWMQRQQEFVQNHTNLHYYPSMGADSLLLAGVSEYSQDDSMSIQRLATMAHPAFQLADAQVLFKPLLKAIGLQVEAVKMSALMKKFGGNVSITGLLQALRIDIVDSETPGDKRSKLKGKGKARKLPKFHIDTGLDMPAFLCDTFMVMIAMKDVVDFEKEKEEKDELEKEAFRRRSLRALKFALDHMEAKPTTTRVNFSADCHSITQHVNMSLLRLVHQFVTMIENINDTRTELKGLHFDSFRGHRKQDSKGSSSGTDDPQSFNDQSDTLQNLHGMSSLDMDTPTPAPSHLSQTSPLAGYRPLESPLGSSPPGSPLYSRQISELNTPRPDKLVLSPGRSPTKKSMVKRSLHSPFSDSVTIEMADTSSPALAEKTIVDEIKENTPKCWRTLYHLLDLYSTMPETKTLGRRPSHSRLSIIEEEPEKISQSQSIPHGSLPRMDRSETNLDQMERQPLIFSKPAPRPPNKTYTGSTFTQSIFYGERIPLVVFGMAKVKRIKISATLSGLKLEADLQNVHASATHREKVKEELDIDGESNDSSSTRSPVVEGVLKRRSRESSVSAYVGHTMIVLLEGVPPSMQTVVTINIAKSQGLYSSYMKKSREHNTGLLTVGKVDVDIPQHPVVLHGMVARSSKRLSNTLQEFIRHPSKVRSHDSVDGGGVTFSQTASRHSELSEAVNVSAVPSEPQRPQKREEPSKPMTIHFKAVLRGLCVGASLLPSLKAQYKMGEVTSGGVTGNKARFTVDLPNHSLSFTSKVKCEPVSQSPSTPHPKYAYTPVMRQSKKSANESVSTPSNLPSEASIDLPHVHIHADYRVHNSETDTEEGLTTDGLTLREGNYFNAVAEVGTFEHSLTTDLLNHLVFVQKVFMKEVNEVVQKVSGGDQPVPIWNESTHSLQQVKDLGKPLLYSFLFRLKGIQITATTPTNNAVRLETDIIELKLSNRVQRANKQGKAVNPNQPLKVFIKAMVDLNLALGTLMKNPMFEEADPEFQHLASFDTRISLRNALQDEIIKGVSKDQEALLISLKRPVIFVQPQAFDKAVLVWLNYKNAYEYWNEQRMALNKEVQTATQQVIEKLPIGQLQQSAPALGTLFLQLTVDDLGICVPMDPFSQGLTTTTKAEESQAALVLTLESTRISACSCGSLVSKGKFTGFCLRFADDFEVSWDEWKPDKDSDGVMNALVVPNGTYEVCSRTCNPQAPNTNAKWILNINWQMRGIDVQLDTNIGKRLSALGNTLTSLAASYDEIMSEDEEEEESDEPSAPLLKPEPTGRKSSSILPEGLPDYVYDMSLDPKTRARLLEKEMNEQARAVEDLRQLGASPSTVDTEEKKLQELQAVVFHDFRQDILQKLKRQGVKASALKDKLGLGNKPSHSRSKSTGAAGIRGKRRERMDPRRLASYAEEGEGEVAPSTRPSHMRTYSLDVEGMSTPKGVTFDSSARSAYLSTDPDSPSDAPLNYRRLDLDQLSTSSSDEDEEAEDPDLAYLRHSANRLARSSESESRGQKIPSPSIGSAGSQKTTSIEPSVDFELDIKVDIEGGKCVLHPKEPKTDGENDAKKGAKQAHPPPSPRLDRKKGKKFTESSSRLLQAPMSVDNTTVFFLPGVDVKVVYGSKTSVTEGGGGQESPCGSGSRLTDDVTPADVFDTSAASGSGSSGSSKKSAVKKANLYAWLSLQQLPEEMLISPALLDFLEQALEPIPLAMINLAASTKNGKSGIRNNLSTDLDASASSLVSTGTYAYAQFPVDVVVYISVQPSLIRFTCLPVSRVECLLRLPSLDVVFSTKKADEPSISESSSQTKGGKRMPQRTPSTGRMRSASGQTTTDIHGGGLSVTACLADFSLYIFHPYGGGQKKTSLAALESSFRRGMGTMNDSDSLPIPDMTGRKDSLSLNVEFVKVNISRSRKGVWHGDLPSMGSAAKLSSLDQQPKAANQVRFSAVCDIGSASFKYDMRRLAEILAFPKAWYRRALARRMFLGEETAVLDSDTGEEEFLFESPLTPESPTLFSPYGRAQTFNTVHVPSEFPANHRRVSSADRNVPVNLEFKQELDNRKRSSTNGSSSQSPTDDGGIVLPTILTPSKEDAIRTPTQTTSDSRVRYRDLTETSSSQFTTPITPGANKAIRDWATLVGFAVNLQRLDIMVNMSNVMGNINWATTNLKSQGRLSIDSGGYKNMKISAGLDSSQLEAKGGIIAGNIDVQNVNTYLHISEDPGKEPDHRAGAQMTTLESRLDYMGCSILMGRISSLDICLKDEWRVAPQDHAFQPLATKRPALIFVHGDLKWDKFHLMISRSTTPDLIKMANKLEEFFTQQLTSSKRVLSAFAPIPGTNKMKAKRKNSGEDASWISEIRHHRHWQRVLENISGCKLSMLPFVLPHQGTILGGTMSLHGNNLSLACFHGINFRSKSWALFTMQEPNICFYTESQDLLDDDGARCTHIEQSLMFQLSHNFTEVNMEKKPMAMVLKLSRGHYTHPTCTSVPEWFHYAFATTEIKDLDNFPLAARRGSESPSERRTTSTRRGTEYNHDTEVIFVLPSLQMHLKTVHKQGAVEPLEGEPKPVVECSFITEFEDHIFVAMDAEAILFLHDLVTNYVREKDKGRTGQRVSKSPETEKKNIQNPTTVLKQDFREFDCKTWRLEPTVRLLSWAGKRIDPVGVDYILQKLGFQHARLTIPKWMQRGCMDPLDKILSLLVNRMILLLKEAPGNEDEAGGS